MSDVHPPNDSTIEQRVDLPTDSDANESTSSEKKKQLAKTAVTKTIASKQVAISTNDLGNRMLGEFRLLRRLGIGGMAEVYLAEQTSLKRQVALKILRADLVSDETYLKRFEQEATAAAALNHPNIVQVYAVGEEAGVHYIAQEYVHGRNLREFLDRHGPPDATVALHIMKQVAAALQAAGDAGIIHRDIKPENIMVSPQGVAKVADFGLARLTEEGDHLNLTQVGVTMGTPLYMSPEQVNGKTLDQRSDLYSFGVSCYHLLAGQPPFHGETALTVAVKHINDEAEPLGRRRPDLPRALCDVIHKMMAKEPDKRHLNAQSVLKELSRIEKSVGTVHTDDITHWTDFGSGAYRTTGLSRFATLFDWRRHRDWWTFTASCLLVGILAAGIGWAMRPKNPLDAPITSKSKVPQLGSAAEQFTSALLKVGTAGEEEAWKAVAGYFPNAKREAQLADAQLATLYLRLSRFDEAMALFQQLASPSVDDVSLKAKGFAGLAVIAGLKKNHAESQRIIAEEVYPIRDRLDREMERLVRETIARNRRILGGQIEKGYEELFRSPEKSEETFN